MQCVASAHQYFKDRLSIKPQPLDSLGLKAESISKIAYQSNHNWNRIFAIAAISISKIAYQSNHNFLLTLLS